MTKRRLHLHVKLAFAFLFCVLLFPFNAVALDKEYAVKAAFLYRFLQFVDWPDGSVQTTQNPMKLCILGPDPFGKMLSPVEQKTIKDKGIKIHTFAQSGESVLKCNLVFISGDFGGNLSETLDFLSQAPILTVSDRSGFVGKDGVLGFTESDGKIKFEVNSKAAERLKLDVSSKLLELAEQII